MADLELPASVEPQAPVNPPPSELTTELKAKYSDEFRRIPSKDQINGILTINKQKKANVKSRKRKAGHISRPANAFILYRMWMMRSAPTVSTELKSIYGTSWNGLFSTLVKHHWDHLPANAKEFWMEMQEDTKTQHAVDNPGYEYRPAKRGEGRAAKKRKTGTPTSSASPPAPFPTTDEPQTPGWDAVPDGYQFTFAVSIVPSHSPSVASPQNSYPVLYSPSPPANEDEHVQSPDYSTPQASPEQSPPDFFTQPSFNADSFDWQTLTTNAVAGPPTYQQYDQAYTPTAERPYTLNAFDRQDFVNFQDDVYSTTANQFPTDGSKWDLNQSPEDLLLTLCRHRFQLEESLDINLDELESDDAVVTTMSPLDQELLVLRREARPLFPPSLYEF